MRRSVCGSYLAPYDTFWCQFFMKPKGIMSRMMFEAVSHLCQVGADSENWVDELGRMS